MNMRIRFQGNEYLFIGDYDPEEGLGDGAIATKEAYENGKASYAHLFINGEVKRFQQVIGHVEDVEVLGPTSAEIKDCFVDNMLTHPSWNKSNEL